VAEAIVAITSEDDSVNAKNEAVKVNALSREFTRTFGELDYALPEFRTITKAAYWDYQRQKVYVRSKQPKRVLTGRRKSSPDAPATNKIIPVQEQRPECCIRCAGMLIYKTGRFSQTVYDLRFSIGGLRRWIVRYTYDRYICWRCKASFNRYVRKSKYGHNLKAYVVYQIIELRIPQHAVAQSLTTLFGFEMLSGSINRIKASSADYYENTYRSILRRIGGGPLVHADETKVTIADQDRYVWVFTSMDEVAFVYSDTREAEAARDVLCDFQGVLVSDFYAGYDSIDCAQQKCLIHLMRDLNDDVLHHPFNDEMNELARSFATLLTAMLETVDRFGLKARHLRKHKEEVDRFYRMLQKRDYQTEVGRAYKKRFEKNRDKLFTFLDYDGVPWNNNNAEHAIKAFALCAMSLARRVLSKEFEIILSC
jgi:hypothetical protein